MSQWTDRYNQNPIHNSLSAIQTALAAIDTGSFKGQEAALHSYERVVQAFQLTKARLQVADPDLTPPPPLNNLNSHWQAVLAELAAFRKDKNVGHLNNANAHVDNVVTSLSTLIVPLSPIDLESLKESAASYRRTLGQYLHNLDEEASAIRTKMASLTTDLNRLSTEAATVKQRSDSMIASYQQQFSTSEEKRRTDFQTAEAQRKKDFDILLAQKVNEWIAAMKQQQTEYQSIVQRVSQDLNTVQAGATERANSILADIQRNKEKADQLVGIITDTGMVGGYQHVANQERDSAKNWRKVALGSLLALAVFAVIAFIETISQQLRWDLFAARLFVATSLGILAAYAALQAEKHERNERKNRKTELELASISPYLYGLPPDQQNKIRGELAMRLFGQSEAPEPTSERKTTGSVLDVLKMALETIETMAKKQ